MTQIIEFLLKFMLYGTLALGILFGLVLIFGAIYSDITGNHGPGLGDE